MKCPNLNCLEGDVTEPTPDTEHLPLICHDCQKRFCPSAQCRYAELNEDNYCRECGNRFPERHEEEDDEGSSSKDRKTAGSGINDLEDFMKALRR